MERIASGNTSHWPELGLLSPAITTEQVSTRDLYVLFVGESTHTTLHLLSLPITQLALVTAIQVVAP